MLFQSQIDQYSNYTDRYLEFKVQFRKEVPRGTHKVNVFFNVTKALDAFNSIVNATREISKIFHKNIERERFWYNLRNMLPLVKLQQHIDLIKIVEPEHYQRIITLVALGVDFEAAYNCRDRIMQLEKSLASSTEGVYMLYHPKIIKPVNNGSEHNK